jgi:predicted transposase YdaD
MERRNNDILWKGMLERVFDDLLRFLFEDADLVFDLDRGFEFLDKELAELYPEPDKKTDTRFVDKLVKVYQRDGTEEWVLVHIEVQAQHDAEFAKRMFKYYCRIFDRYDRPLTAIAIFTGKDGKRMPDRYQRNFEGTELTYRYNTLYILDFVESELEASGNPFALVALFAKKALQEGKILDPELLQQKLSLAKLLLSKGFSKWKVEGMLSFLKNYLRFADPGFNRIFDKELDGFTGKTNTMDIIEQVKQIRIEEALEQVVKNLLTKTNFSVKEIAEITGVSVAFVEDVRLGR